MKLVNIPNYTLVSNHRQNRKGGGTGILLRNGITYKPRKDLDQFKDKMIETTFIDRNSIDERKITVGSLYRPPNSSLTEFLAKLNETTSKISTEDKDSILGMGHNLDLLKCNIHKQIQALLDDLTDKDLLPTITRPTRITQNTATLLDKIFVSERLHQFFEVAVLLSHL